MHAISAWLVKIRCAPSRHLRNGAKVLILQLEQQKSAPRHTSIPRIIRAEEMNTNNNLKTVIRARYYLYHSSRRAMHACVFSQCLFFRCCHREYSDVWPFPLHCNVFWLASMMPLDLRYFQRNEQRSRVQLLLAVDGCYDRDMVWSTATVFTGQAGRVGVHSFDA